MVQNKYAKNYERDQLMYISLLQRTTTLTKNLLLIL